MVRLAQEPGTDSAVRAGRSRARAVAAPALLCLAYAILLLCWGGANPPFAAPDEWSHYLRALGSSGGRLIGEPYAYPVAAGSTVMEQRSYAWINQAARLVAIPAGLYAPNLDCNAGRPAATAACLDDIAPVAEATTQPTPVGNYQPLPYILPGLVARLGHDPLGADRLGRLAGGLTCWAFLAAACWLLWGGSALSLAGLLAAVTPMVLFLAASLTPSGVEIASGIAFAAGLLRLWREPQPGNWIWLVAGAAGATLALSRSTGPLYVGLDLLVFAGLVGVRGASCRVAGRRTVVSLAAAFLALGALLSLMWERAYGSKLKLDPTAVGPQVGHALIRPLSALHEEIGIFGSLDTTFPLLTVAVWAAIIATLVGLALWAGSRPERLVLGAVVGGSLILPIGFSIALVTATGFDVQGRHLLPVVVMTPLLAGEIIFRHRARLPSSLLRVGSVALPVGVALVHLVAWYWNARRHSVGSGGPLWFANNAAWSPPLGWLPWLAAAGSGGICLTLLAVYWWIEPDMADGDGRTPVPVVERK